MSGMRFSLSRTIVGLALTAVLVLALTLTVAAQIPDNGEPAGDAPAAAGGVEQEEEVRSLTPALQPGDLPANGEMAYLPDKVTEVEEAELLRKPASLTATDYYKFISANTFTPYDSSLTYNYSGSGCVYRTGGTSFSEHDLQLPQGADLQYIRVYFYDNDAVNDANVFLFVYDGLGNNTQLASAASTGTPGQSSAGSGFFSHIVDNVTGALSIRLSYESGTTLNLRICGVRILYQFTLPSVVFLPLIMH